MNASNDLYDTLKLELLRAFHEKRDCLGFCPTLSPYDIITKDVESYGKFTQMSLFKAFIEMPFHGPPSADLHEYRSRHSL